MSDPASQAVPPKTTDKPSADWNRIQVLYLAGVPREQIAKDYGVSVAAIDKQAQRKGWTHQRKALIIRTETVTRRAVKDATDKLRPMLQQGLEEIAGSDALRSPTRSLAHADAKANVLLKVTQAGKVVHGWGDMTESTINFSLIQDGLRDTDPDLIPPAIDVPSESMPTQSEPQ